MRALLLSIILFIKTLFSKNKVETFEPLKMKPNLPLKLNLQYFAEGDDEEDEEDDEDKGKSDDEEDEKPYAEFKTKEELQKRITRAERSGQKALAKKLGFSSVEEMEAAVSGKKGKGKKSEDDEDVDQLIEDKLKEVNQKAFKRLVNAEVKLVAKELGFADHEDALALADLSEVKENDKGDIEGVKEALEALAEKKPHLLKSSGGGNFGSDVKAKKKAEKESLEALRKQAQSRGQQSSSAAYDPWKN